MHDTYHEKGMRLVTVSLHEDDQDLADKSERLLPTRHAGNDHPLRKT